MEEDIQIIEATLCNKDIIIRNRYWVGSKFLDAVENVLTRLKDYEQIEKEHQKENGELRERVKELEKVLNKYGGVKELEKYILDLSRLLGNVSIDAMVDTIKNNYILTSKIIEKIEEIDKAYEDSKDEEGNSEYYYPDYTIRVLQDLLEEINREGV